MIYCLSRHIGDSAVTCLCPHGFKGSKCNKPDLNELSGKTFHHFHWNIIINSDLYENIIFFYWIIYITYHIRKCTSFFIKSMVYLTRLIIVTYEIYTFYFTSSSYKFYPVFFATVGIFFKYKMKKKSFGMISIDVTRKFKILCVFFLRHDLMGFNRYQIWP